MEIMGLEAGQVQVWEQRIPGIGNNMNKNSKCGLYI